MEKQINWKWESNKDNVKIKLQRVLRELFSNCSIICTQVHDVDQGGEHGIQFGPMEPKFPNTL